ncbi:hypothetical protein LPW36_03235 [Jinshanibacter sp. LJY008]|uniref:Uncharacterized protein n=1 Tax=Limnobaculum eriocheiris TaxID=2897391 RepID=A0A9X1MT50_9GAMM|nr:hypothetical protein [Limnobaculum eriocheiris]MCD1125051.1 hypothetical protein [Limnobaculum eriocheiris]
MLKINTLQLSDNLRSARMTVNQFRNALILLSCVILVFFRIVFAKEHNIQLIENTAKSAVFVQSFSRTTNSELTA